MLLGVVSVLSLPYDAHASFFSGLITKMIGSDAQAAEVAPQAAEPEHNSQTVPLLESSINPDNATVNSDSTMAPLFADETLISNSETLDTDADLNKYDSLAKISVYVVKKGDTVSSIAKTLHMSVSDLIASNADLKKADLLKVGQTLVVIPTKSIDTIDTSVDKTVKSSDTSVKKTDTSKKVSQKIKSKETDSVAVTTPSAPENQPTSVQIQSPVVTAAPSVVNPQNTVVEPTEQVTPTQPLPQASENTVKEKYIWPYAPGVGRVSQGLHADQAFDFAAPLGTPILAIADGTVFITHPSGYNGGYGEYVVINFNDGRQAIFGHMSKVIAKAGDVVKQGDVIGLVGSTGDSTGPHCHIGWRGTLGDPFIGLKVNDTDLRNVPNNE